MPPDRPHTNKPRSNIYARPQSKALSPPAPPPLTDTIPHRPPPVPYPTGHSSSSASTVQASSSSFTHTLSQQPFAYPTPSAPESIGTIPLYPLLSRIRIHVVPTKLDGQLPVMYSYVESLGGIVSPIESCSVAVTVLKGRPRLLKVLGEAAVDGKWVLSMDWLKNAHDICVQYRTSLLAARNQRRIQARAEAQAQGVTGIENPGEMTDGEQAESQPSSTASSSKTTIQQTYVSPPQLAPRKSYVIPGTSSHVRQNASSTTDPPVIDDDHDRDHGHDRKGSPSPAYMNSQYPRLPDLLPFPEDISFEDIPNRAVQRCSPLVCVNQDIVCASFFSFSLSLSLHDLE
jgi:hypothetical protein